MKPLPLFCLTLLSSRTPQAVSRSLVFVCGEPLLTFRKQSTLTSTLLLPVLAMATFTLTRRLSSPLPRTFRRSTWLFRLTATDSRSGSREPFSTPSRAPTSKVLMQIDLVQRIALLSQASGCKSFHLNAHFSVKMLGHVNRNLLFSMVKSIHTMVKNNQKATQISLRYTPTIHAALRMASPQAMPKESQTTFSLLPPTSFHPIATSAIGIPALSASMSISTSKIQPSLCMYGMMYGRAGRVNSLKPHWVSLIDDVAGGVRRRSRRWKECMRAFRKKDRCEGVSNGVQLHAL